MSAMVCPYKPVAQHEVAVHEHHFPLEVLLADGTWIQDCACGHRQRVRKAVDGHVAEVFPDGLVRGGTSLENCLFLRQPNGSFTDRWSTV